MNISLFSQSLKDRSSQSQTSTNTAAAGGRKQHTLYSWYISLVNLIFSLSLAGWTRWLLEELLLNRAHKPLNVYEYGTVFGTIYKPNTATKRTNDNNINNNKNNNSTVYYFVYYRYRLCSISSTTMYHTHTHTLTHICK